MTDSINVSIPHLFLLKPPDLWTPENHNANIILWDQVDVTDSSHKGCRRLCLRSRDVLGLLSRFGPLLRADQWDGDGLMH